MMDIDFVVNFHDSFNRKVSIRTWISLYHRKSFQVFDKGLFISKALLVLACNLVGRGFLPLLTIRISGQ